MLRRVLAALALVLIVLGIAVPASAQVLPFAFGPIVTLDPEVPAVEEIARIKVREMPSTAEGTPKDVVIRPGTGAEVRCAYAEASSTGCAYTYPRSSAGQTFTRYEVSAFVQYDNAGVVTDGPVGSKAVKVRETGDPNETRELPEGYEYPAAGRGPSWLPQIARDAIEVGIDGWDASYERIKDLNPIAGLTYDEFAEWARTTWYGWRDAANEWIDTSLTDFFNGVSEWTRDFGEFLVANQHNPLYRFATQVLVDFTSGFVDVVGDAAIGVAELAAGIFFTANPIRLFFDPEGYLADLTVFAETVGWAVVNYQEVLKTIGVSMLHVDLWREGKYAEATGAVAAEIVMIVFGGKGIDKIAKARQAAKATDKVDDVKPGAGTTPGKKSDEPESADEREDYRDLKEEPDANAQVDPSKPSGPAVPTSGNFPAVLEKGYQPYPGGQDAWNARYLDDNGNLEWNPERPGGAVPGTIKEATPQAGDLWSRFGGEGGAFLSPHDTPFVERALPPSSLSERFNVYRVTGNPLPDGFYIQESKVDPWFDQPGGGIQFEIKRLDGDRASVADLLESDPPYLETVDWRTVNWD